MAIKVKNADGSEAKAFKGIQKIDLATGKTLEVVRNVPVKSLTPNPLRATDKQTIAVNTPDVHVLKMVDPVSKAVASKTVFPQGTTRTSVSGGSGSS